jgi:hypothetical protein
MMRQLIGVLLLCTTTACAPPIKKIPPAQPATTPVLWREPAAGQDLLYGTGGRQLAPRPGELYTLVKRDTGGFSTTLDLRDAEGREWSAKLGVEAQPEVIASRILWALGYPQPPSYYAPVVRVKEKDVITEEGPVRLRPKVKWLHSNGLWSWHQNPFADSQPYRGLLVLLMVLNSTDLKDDNNTVYLLRRDGTPPEQWYTVKDLGASLGDTGKFNPKRNDVAAFERHAFITRVDSHGFVHFAFKGRHKELLRRITSEDVRWACRRLGRLSDDELAMAFKAGGMAPAIADRFMRKIRQKVQEGLKVSGARASR